MKTISVGGSEGEEEEEEERVRMNFMKRGGQADSCFSGMLL